ncbi:MAG TPA: Gfo/Idh/MocA family oxidoreductase [Chitinophagaceae bacterium]|nr:Gfo/Idh/MocA family oxidoreductase [Chitinophagaceae bacterium]
MNRKLRMGMVGGGPGAFIGAVHRLAAGMDGQIELVCGAFSSHPDKSRKAGEDLFLDPARVYGSYQEMMETEKSLPDGERMDFVSIVTPNHLHFEPAKLALENGFHVVVDKPMTLSLKEAEDLKEIVDKSGLILCLTHTYTGYPMVKEARQIVAGGRLGKITKIYVEYPQGWLSQPLEKEGNKQAAWRTDPKRSGIAGAMGDIGTHAANLAEYVSGLKITRLCADINTIVPGRALDDDGAVLLEFEKEASGVLIATQVATGEENCIKVRVYGEKGGLEWKQDEANTLLLKFADKPTEVLRTGGPGTSAIAAANTRTPPGHPEGYLEAFANLYHNFARCVRARMNGTEPKSEWLDFPDAEDGVRGMLFIEKVIASGKSDQKWTAM